MVSKNKATVFVIKYMHLHSAISQKFRSCDKKLGLHKWPAVQMCRLISLQFAAVTPWLRRCTQTCLISIIVLIVIGWLGGVLVRASDA